MSRRTGQRHRRRLGVAGAAAAFAILRAAACLADEQPPPAPAAPPPPAAPAAPAANPAEALERPVVEVIGTSPLPGLGTDRKDVPGNVQIYSSSDLSGQRQANTTDFLEQNATSITANAAQGNPFQPDVSFRGFTASPLLGTPQGVSVFQDGVRINEPFGDIVNWDLLPQSAIAGIQVIPGSNPMFGLNTLGGAIAVYTKSGAEYPGASAEVSGGSFGRRTVEAEWGASQGPLDFFITGNLFDDQGWADHDPSRVRQLFAKAGWQNDKTDLDASLTFADNNLQGTQTLPLSFLYDIHQAYTYPDTNINKLTFLTIKGSRFLSDAALFGGNLYYRHYRNSSVSSNVNDDFGDIDPDTGEIDEVAATNDQSTITQDSYGGGLQVVLTSAPAGMKNQLTFGASIDEAQARFTQYSQDADLTAVRGTVPAGDFELETDADTDSRGYGVFAQNILNLTKQWTFTISGRYNHVGIRVGDRTGTAPLLNGDTSFSRFNPSAGINFNPTDHLTAYASYDEGARAPTAIELTCADPNAPCKLPNDFLADPPLKQVVSRTVEVGARGSVSRVWRWSAAVYQTRLSDDIEFISTSAGAGNAGYFANVGRTQRRGFELSGDGRVQSLTISARYSFTDATFQSAFLQSSPDNSSADAGGAIQVEPGDRIPSLPRQVLKMRLGYELTKRLGVGVNVLVSDGVYARGDENNQDVNGKLPSYTLVNLDAHYRPLANLEIFARINNVFDRRYYDFGILGQNFFTGPNRTFGPAAGFDPVAEQFRGPGAPLGAWIGVRYSLGAAASGADSGGPGDDER